MSRKKIPKTIKDAVKKRQNGKCACCLERGEHYHHLIPYCIRKKHDYHNIFLLCKKHHSLFHLGDPTTFQSMYEYAWYILQGCYLPENLELSEISLMVCDSLSTK